MHENEVSQQVVEAAFAVHSGLGPGLLESIYCAALAYELEKRGLSVQREVPVTVVYDGQDLGIGFRADLMVENLVVVEVKSVEQKSPVHAKQLLTYLKLMDKRLGLLINFNERVIKNGITRIANDLA